MLTPFPTGTDVSETIGGKEHSRALLKDPTGADAMGAVAASPAANTLLGRLKAIFDEIVKTNGYVDGLEGFLDGVEALLARTRRQVSRFTLAAIVVVVSLVGVGGALAGSNALDAGLDRALVIRAEKIVHELQEVMPPLPSAAPSPDASAEPSESAEPEESTDPSADPSTDPSETAKPEESAEPSADPTLPPGGDDEDDEGDGGEEGDDSGAQITARLAAVFVQAPATLVQEDPPVLPPGIDSDEFGAGGPWAILGPDGEVLASSIVDSSEFPVLDALATAGGSGDVRTELVGQIEYRVMTLPVRHPQDPDGRVLAYVQVAGRLDVRDAQRQNLFGSLIVLGLLGLGAALLVAYFVTRRVIAPIAAAAARERAMVAKASHELRTPVAVMKASWSLTLDEAPEATILVQDVSEAEALDLPAGAKLAYITQTTLSVDETAEIIGVLRGRFPQIHAPRKEDICYATSNRQWAVKEMLGEIDLLLVIGSRNSSNSNRLVETARAGGVASYLIDDDSEIERDPISAVEWMSDKHSTRQNLVHK